MQSIFSSITKEQYESLSNLAGGNELNFKISRNEHAKGDLLSAFLKEYVAKENIVSNPNNDVNFYKLFEKITN